MKVYILKIDFFGELINETGEREELIGVYKDKNKAKEKLLEIVNEDKKIGYIADKGYEPIEDFALMFWQQLDNWNSYYEIGIKEVEVE